MIQHLYSLPIPIPPFIYRIFRRQTNKKRYRTWDYINIFVAKMRVSKLKNLTWATVVLGVFNVVVIVIGGIFVLVAFPSCGVDAVLPILMVLLASAVRIVTMVGTGIAQKATAASILSSPVESSVVDAVSRHERRMRYKRWLWWTRIAMVLSVVQFVGAVYLIFVMVKYISHDGASTGCVLGGVSNGDRWKQILMIIYMVIVCFMVLLQCFTGSDVLRWRSFYATHDNAWKAHYHEVFDHGIREALCCLGRVKYLSVLEEDEVHSVARLLGDLVAYRASGTGHLELLAGLALLQKHSESPKSYEESTEAPQERLEEAVAFHPFAEAAYTGPLLDFGRNPILFPCAWLYRQGVLTPWTRNRRPVLEGDNWWRGHAAAFLKYANLSPESLRRGRVCQAKCEAAYFILVLHHLRSIVIAVRGTETPEDLLIDGLCRECALSVDDLDGLLNGNIQADIRQTVLASFPHYGHSGIVEAARDLFMQIEGNPVDKDSSCDSSGFLSSLLGAGGECEGYKIRIVGHSLGGSIAALLGLKLYCRFPNLHVFSYGTLPCVDSVIADACSEFVTSIVFNNEFSARLSVASIMRLRASALMVLSEDTSTDSAMIFRLARRFLYVSKFEATRVEEKDPYLDYHSGASDVGYTNDHLYGSHELNGAKSGNRDRYQEFPLFEDAEMNDSSEGIGQIDSSCSFTNPFHEESNVSSFDNPISQFLEAVPSSDDRSDGGTPEMFLPGLVIHILPKKRSFHMTLWKGWRVQERADSYQAFVVNREIFKDIIVSPSMFLDHLPWRVHYAMQKVLETRHSQGLLDGSQMV